MIHHGDCIEVMATLDAESIAAIVTDPPYGLGFMGKAWDTPGSFVERKPVRANKFDHIGGNHNPSSSADAAKTARSENRRSQEWHEAWAREALRIAKPGAHLLAFGGTRTYHRLAAAIEDAGWEIRDCLVWAYASGFPKSLDVSKAIDKAAGAERTRHLVPTKPGNAPEQAGAIALGATGMRDESAPVTPDAEKWQGWGTALKPAWEPIVLARKPLRGTVAGNVLAHGTGALNIDGCRVRFASDADRQSTIVPQPVSGYASPILERPSGRSFDPGLGRWPANVVLTDPIFDGDVPGVVGGGMASPGTAAGVKGSSGFADGYDGAYTVPYGDTGTYSRFFLVPKAARSDREPVTHRAEARANVHPTVKPTELMRHLVRLVTPPGGIVLDPFLGSGTTALAAEMEGFSWVGIERDAEYVAIAEARLNGVQKGMGLSA